MIAIVDYDAGNLKSVEKALKSLDIDSVTTREPDVIRAADKVILPGVGAFGEAMDSLNRYGLAAVLREIAAAGKPLLGICLGMQLLFEKSEESQGVQGLGILPGEVLRIPPAPGLKIPHMGWNSLRIRPGTRLFQNVPDASYVYFVHSYYVKARDEQIVAASTEYSAHIHASVESGNVFGCQFHPEKSSKVGLRILANFAMGEEAEKC